MCPIHTAHQTRRNVNIDLKGLLEDGDQTANLYMQDKDVLFIPAAQHFYIIGQVKEPGSFALTDREITLVEAISRAGGFTPIAARNRTRIIRVEKGVEKIITVKIVAIMQIRLENMLLPFFLLQLFIDHLAILPRTSIQSISASATPAFADFPAILRRVYRSFWAFGNSIFMSPLSILVVFATQS